MRDHHCGRGYLGNVGGRNRRPKSVVPRGSTKERLTTRLAWAAHGVLVLLTIGVLAGLAAIRRLPMLLDGSVKKARRSRETPPRQLFYGDRGVHPRSAAANRSV